MITKERAWQVIDQEVRKTGRRIDRDIFDAVWEASRLSETHTPLDVVQRNLNGALVPVRLQP